MIVYRKINLMSISIFLIIKHILHGHATQRLQILLTLTQIKLLKSVGLKNSTKIFGLQKNKTIFEKLKIGINSKHQSK